MGVIQDLHKETTLKELVKPQPTDSLAAETYVDMLNSLDRAYLLIVANNESGGEISMDVSLQDSTDHSTWSDYQDVSIGALGANEHTVKLVALDSYDRYIKVDSVTNGSASYYLGVAIVAPQQDTTK